MSDSDPRAALRILLDRLGADEARRTVGALSSRTAKAELERLIAEDLAAGLLADNVPRPAIRDRLVQQLGMSWRTAYRVIDGALAAFTSRPASGAAPHAIAKQPDATPTPTEQPEKEQHMTPNEIAAERTAIVAELATINTAEAEAEAKAKDAAAAYADERRRQADPDYRKGQTVDALQKAMQAANLAQRRAHETLKALQDREARLRGRLAYLVRIGGGEAAVKAAQEKADAAAAAFDAAEAATSACRSTLAQIVELIATETAEVERGRKAAGGEILAAIKAGADPAAVSVRSSDRLAALAVAKENAEAELAAATQGQQKAQHDRDVARHAVLVAEAAITEAACLHAEQAAVAALHAHLAAVARAKLGGYAPTDLRHVAAAWWQARAQDDMRQALATVPPARVA